MNGMSTSTTIETIGNTTTIGITVRLVMRRRVSAEVWAGGAVEGIHDAVPG